MVITPHAKFINYRLIDDTLWRIQSYIEHRYGFRQAEIDIEPLRWYISTGRAPLDFIRLLLEAKPFMIARKLHEGGSYDEAIERIKEYIGWDPEGL